MRDVADESGDLPDELGAQGETLNGQRVEAVAGIVDRVSLDEVANRGGIRGGECNVFHGDRIVGRAECPGV